MHLIRGGIFLSVALWCALLAGSSRSAVAQDQPRPKNNTVEDAVIDAGLSLLLHKKQRCNLKQIGWIEPTQGVWQDDDFFEDRPGKQLTASDGRTYTAELKMARFRDTLLYGILRPAGEAPVDRRNTIMIAGTSSYGTPVAVKMRITLKQGDLTRTLYESPLQFVVNLGGQCLSAPVPFAAALDASKGIPAPPAEPFHFSSTGGYTIKAELYDAKDHATGLYTQVSGEVVDTAGPVVQFVPVYSGKEEARNDLVYLAASYVTKKAESLARYVPRYGPMYFPLEADAMGAIVRAPRDIDRALAHSRDVAESKMTGWKRDLLPVAHLTGINTGNADADVVAAQLFNDFDGEAGVGHVGRLVVLTRGDIPGLLEGGAAAFTFSTKTIFATSTIRFMSILHEIVHSEPQFLWSSTNMLAECGHDYHDNEGYQITRNGTTSKVRGMINGKIHGVAYGVRTQHVLPFEAYNIETDPGTGKFQWQLDITKPPTGDEGAAFNGESVPQLRQRLDASYELMGSQGERPNVPEFRWITQCTYHHLVDDAMQQPQDPHYLLVRAVLAHGRNGWYGGYLDPVYDVEDAAVLAKPSTGSWSIAALDSAGTERAVYGFDVTWKSSDSPRVRNAVPVTLRIPYDPRIAVLELRSPSGVAARLAVSAAPPVLHIVAPGGGAVLPRNRPVTLRWTATSAGGAPVLSSVYYSADGKNWLDRAFETKATSLTVFLARNVRTHYLRVVAGDGSRSSEQTVVVTTP